MPYIKPEKRTKETLKTPSNRGELNWALHVVLLKYFETTVMGYDAHCELKAMLNELLQGLVREIDLTLVTYAEFTEETREVMEKLDNMLWDYLALTGDTAGCKQVLRDVEHEWNRRLTDKYEDEKIKENGDVYVFSNRHPKIHKLG